MSFQAFSSSNSEFPLHGFRQRYPCRLAAVGSAQARTGLAAAHATGAVGTGDAVVKGSVREGVGS